jgi:hypothetical protein
MDRLGNRREFEIVQFNCSLPITQQFGKLFNAVVMNLYYFEILPIIPTDLRL